MAYNVLLAEKIRKRFASLDHVEEKEMMGGIAFMLHDKMCVGVMGDDMMCRVDAANIDTLLERNGCRIMDFTGKPMKNFVLIDETGMHRPADFEFWIQQALDFNPKAKSSKKRKK